MGDAEFGQGGGVGGELLRGDGQRGVAVWVAGTVEAGLEHGSSVARAPAPGDPRTPGRPHARSGHDSVEVAVGLGVTAGSGRGRGRGVAVPAFRSVRG
ncbi:hypothetical protein GCM10010492_07760 [Saccharothrix mutabilis subsp. mutabilis]|uniref:Uncharacterized protein n=1 Tax=Saccharothrix mutabilis subsp. mutabilis TaxID=66855 RepID=A0ABN0T4M7_9PSEU